MGLISNIAAVFCLVVLWGTPLPALWWVALGLLVIDVIFTKVLAESLRLYGMKDPVSITWGIVCTVVQVSTLVVGIWVFWKRFL